MQEPSVAIVVLDPRDRVLLLRRGPTAPWMPNRWNMPGGRIEPSESAFAAALRETYEEAGLRVHALAPLTHVGALTVFRADDWTGRVRLLDGEHSRSAWVPIDVAWTLDLIPPQREILRQIVRA